MELIYPVLLGIFGAMLGLTFADIDLAPPLPLKHRSAWTHGPLVPVGIGLLVTAYPSTWPFAVGFLATYAMHLVADMFPGSWRGSALINLYPIHGSLPPLLSFVWLAGGVGYTFYTWMALISLPVDWLWPIQLQEVLWKF
ncbi:MAG: hypothetical protein KJ077_05940 [Anaerolineae bacterium]|nr:hypothetical protein [Anaerolineae bacterium]